MKNRIVLGALLVLALVGRAEAGRRSPVYADVDLGVAVRPGLSADWGEVPVDMEVRLGLGFWLGERLAAVAGVGLLSGTEVETTAIGDLGPAVERFRLVPVRLGLKLNLWPRPDWIAVNLTGGVSLAVGFHEYKRGGAVLGREDVRSLGAGGGVEITVVKFKRHGLSLKVQYYLQPAELARDSGFLAHGSAELGGLEVSLGWIMFLGGPR